VGLKLLVIVIPSPTKLEPMRRGAGDVERTVVVLLVMVEALCRLPGYAA
jgi:hypothetical protein